MNYEEFLQVPHIFMNDVVEILTIKKKWGLELTRVIEAEYYKEDT